jgi:CarD family transcriptional regulator
MNFQVGDKVIHRSYGLGEIIELDEKELSGTKTRYYVVQVQNLTLWVPIESSHQSSLRFPTPENDFEKIFTILKSPAEPLSDDRLDRKNTLSALMNDGTLESVSQVVRDLSAYHQIKKLNDNDTSTLRRAMDFLLNEWKFALSVSASQAEHDLRLLLGEMFYKVK